MAFLFCAMVLISVLQVSDLPSTNPCYKGTEEIKRFCANTAMYACLPDVHGHLYPVCRDNIINMKVNITYYLGDGSIQAHKKVISLRVSSYIYTIIATIIIGNGNGYVDNSLSDIPPLGCNLTEESVTTFCKHDNELKATCLPGLTCKRENISCLTPKHGRVNLVLYNSQDDTLFLHSMAILKSNDRYYYYFAKKLCEYETNNTSILESNNPPAADYTALPSTGKDFSMGLLVGFFVGLFIGVLIIVILVVIIIRFYDKLWTSIFRKIRGKENIKQEETNTADRKEEVIVNVPDRKKESVIRQETGCINPGKTTGRQKNSEESTKFLQ